MANAAKADERERLKAVLNETPVTDAMAKARDDAAAYVVRLEAERIGAINRAQAFFAQLAAEARKPHFGDAFRDYQRALLLRAQEQGLYTPEEP
jgi:hypothetical protein